MFLYNMYGDIQFFCGSVLSCRDGHQPISGLLCLPWYPLKMPWGAILYFAVCKHEASGRFDEKTRHRPGAKNSPGVFDIPCIFLEESGRKRLRGRFLLTFFIDTHTHTPRVVWSRRVWFGRTAEKISRFAPQTSRFISGLQISKYWKIISLLRVYWWNDQILKGWL